MNFFNHFFLPINRRSTYFGRYKRSHSSKRSFEQQQQHRFGRNYSQSLGSSLNDDNLSPPPPSSSLLLSPSSLSSTSTTSRPLSSSNVPFPITDKYLTPNSPISPRVKNFNLDMKILVLSRNDNPYLMKQLERSNSLTSNNSSITTAVDEQEYFAMDQQTTTTSHSALHTPMFNRRNYYRINNNGYGRSSSTSTTRQQHQQHRSTLSFTFDFDNQKNMNDNEKNLHEQLIRSPPPNFPEKLSHFLFTENLIKNL